MCQLVVPQYRGQRGLGLVVRPQLRHGHHHGSRHCRPPPTRQHTREDSTKENGEKRAKEVLRSPHAAVIYDGSGTLCTTRCFGRDGDRVITPCFKYALGLRVQSRRSDASVSVCVCVCVYLNVNGLFCGVFGPLPTPYWHQTATYVKFYSIMYTPEYFPSLSLTRRCRSSPVRPHTFLLGDAK